MRIAFARCSRNPTVAILAHFVAATPHRPHDGATASRAKRRDAMRSRETSRAPASDATERSTAGAPYVAKRPKAARECGADAGRQPAEVCRQGPKSGRRISGRWGAATRSARRPGLRHLPLPLALSAAPRRSPPEVRDQPSQDGPVAGQLEVIDPGVIRKAEAVAAHPSPDTNGVVGDVLLVDVALAGQEGGRHRVKDLSDREVQQRRADDGVDA